MPDLSSLAPLVDWIESHEKTVDLLKWLALLLVAWAVGLFKFLRQKFRLPIATIEEHTSRCLIEEFDEFQGHTNVVRASFLIEAGLVNTTSEPVVIRHFSLAVRRRRPWRPWKPELIALSLPARPRHPTGSSVKLLKNWFSKFSDEFQDLTLHGEVDPKHHNSAYLLFVSFTPGNWSPKYDGEYVRVKILIHLTTGETRTAKGRVLITRNKEKFEEWVPGILEQVAHETAWGGTRA